MNVEDNYSHPEVALADGLPKLLESAHGTLVGNVRVPPDTPTYRKMIEKMEIKR